MKIDSWQWHLHRMAVDRIGWLRPYSKRTGSKKMLFISENDAIGHAQIFPFFFHAGDLGIEMRELPLAQFLKGRNPYCKDAVDAVCFQTWFDLTPQAMLDLINNIKSTWPKAKIAYFDWFAPIDLRYAQVLNDHVAVYVKKHVLKDLTGYGQPTVGDTNLNDYYAKRHGIAEPEFCFPIPEGFFDKLWLGPHFVFSDYIMPHFLGAFPHRENRSIDLHARIAVKGSEWYTAMRQEALDKATQWEDRANVVCRGRVSRDEFFNELYDSKLCFSPFGYGEFCWRDFEAMFTGSLLLKPDMSHLDYCPEAFIPYETYVPLAWDLSDFDEKVDYYLNHPQEREAITRNAFELMATYFRTRQFLNDVKPFLQRLAFTT